MSLDGQRAVTLQFDIGTLLTEVHLVKCMRFAHLPLHAN